MRQTVEEAAKAFAEECRIVNIKAGLDYPYDEIDMRNAFEAGAEWQAKQSPWISVKERLPEEDGYYFVTDGDVVKKVYFFKRWNKFALTKKYPHLFYDEGVIKAYIPVPYFNEILEDNKDVLERIKEKGD